MTYDHAPSLWDVEAVEAMPAVRDMEVRPVGFSDVTEFCRRYHYTRSGGNAYWPWGLWQGQTLFGVVAYGLPSLSTETSVFGPEQGVGHVWHMARLAMAEDALQDTTPAQARAAALSVAPLPQGAPMTATAVDDFLTWARDDRNRSPHTLARYRATLSQLDDPATATREDVEAWWATRLHLAPATRANELACLRSFYAWATRFGHRADDPTRRLDAPKVDNRIPRGIGESDLKRLFAATDDTPDLRRAIALGAYGGLRVSEAAGLDWTHVDLERRRLYVRGKGRKERAIGLGAVLLDKLLPVTGGNVVTAGGRPYAGPTLQRKVNRLMARHGIEHTFHDLRKRGASLAIARTHDIYAVSKAFGWSSIETASSYAAVSDDTLDAIAEAMS